MVIRNNTYYQEAGYIEDESEQIYPRQVYGL